MARSEAYRRASWIKSIGACSFHNRISASASALTWPALPGMMLTPDNRNPNGAEMEA